MGQKETRKSSEHCRVDADDLIEALNGGFVEGIWFLDLERGEVLFVSVEELRADPEEPYENPRYRPIRPLESSIGFGIMEDFVEELPWGRPRRSLERALRHRKPFRSFKDALLDFPSLREAWFKFHNARMLVLAEDWLEEEAPGAQLNQVHGLR